MTKSSAANKKRPSDAKTDTLTAEEGEQDGSGGENDNSNSDPSFIGGYSKKKQQYIDQRIEDRSGVFDFEADPAAYKKARKRL